MLTGTSEQAIHTLEITKDEEIAAPIETVFETLLEQLGPLNEAGKGSPLPMTLEAVSYTHLTLPTICSV